MELHWRQPGTVDHELIWGTIGLLVILTAVFVPVDRVLGGLGYRCAFRQATGYPCPTCGTTRALVLAASLRMRAAFVLNPLATIVFVGLWCYVPWALGSVILRARRPRIAETGRRGRWLVLLTGGLIVLANWAYMLAATRATP